MITYKKENNNTVIIARWDRKIALHGADAPLHCLEVVSRLICSHFTGDVTKAPPH